MTYSNKKRFISHNFTQLNIKRQELNLTQEMLAEKMNIGLKTFDKAKLDQSKISRMLKGEDTISILELLLFSKIFNCSPIDLLHDELKDFCTDIETVALKAFITETDTDKYLTELESEGRVLAFSKFPSYLFCSESQPLRKAQFNKPSFSNKEYYTLDSYLNFIFSPISKFSVQERLKIIDAYIDYFDTSKKGNFTKQIIFFSRHHYPPLGRFANIEFFPKKGLIIILAPIFQENEGDIFLEIRNKNLCEQVDDFYLNKIEPIENRMNLLKMGRKALIKLEQGLSLEETMIYFYKECLLSMPDSNDPIKIGQNFSPDAQKILI